jgi:hypothetical protein
MKKLMTLCAIALSLNTITVNAQYKPQDPPTSLTGVSMETQTVGRSKSNISNNRSLPISIYFGKGGCTPGFGICRIDIGSQAVSRVTSDNQLTGTATSDDQGNLNIDLVSNATNRAFVEKLKANGALEFDQDVSFKEVAQKLQEGSATAKAANTAGYDVRANKKVEARMIGGTITITIGRVTITIKW